MCLKSAGRVANSGDPDQMLHSDVSICICTFCSGWSDRVNTGVELQ